MNFGAQIKSIRTSMGMTQEQFAGALNVTRQAVSNWENDRNLPDLEMLITIAKTCSVSLDELILGENTMNNMTEKLVKDTDQNRKAKFNAISFCVGALLLIIGGALLAIKAMSVEYIDAQGILHENFFLLPLAFLFLAAGVATFFITGVKNIVAIVKNKNGAPKGSRGAVITASVVLVVFIVLFILLVLSNQ